MMVAAQCQRQVYYSVYGDSALKHDLHTFHTFCRSRNITVGKCIVIIICKCIVIIIMSVATATCRQSYSILCSWLLWLGFLTLSC